MVQCKTQDALVLRREAAVTIYGNHISTHSLACSSNDPLFRCLGTLAMDKRAPGGVELQADFWQVVGHSSGDIENVASEVRAPSSVRRFC